MATKQELEKENQKLKDDLAQKELENIQSKSVVTNSDSTFDKYNKEMNKIRSNVQDANPNKIVVHERNDHKNISLWRKDGKRIGPLHPANAEKTFKDFWNRGIVLSTKMPTPEEVAAYKESKEYILEHEEYLKIRKIKDKSLKKGKMEEYSKMIAKQLGKTVEQVTNVLKAPVPLSERPNE